MPLFEAITNSLQAIEDCNNENGFINIEFNRKQDSQTSIFTNPGGLKLLKINNFTIKDNGIGFTPENFDSFLTYDSIFRRIKAEKVKGDYFG